MFGRATIRLGIGPHSSYRYNYYDKFTDNRDRQLHSRELH